MRVGRRQPGGPIAKSDRDMASIYSDNESLYLSKTSRGSLVETITIGCNPLSLNSAFMAHSNLAMIWSNILSLLKIGNLNFSLYAELELVFAKEDSNVAFSLAHPANVIVKSGSIEFWMCKIGAKSRWSAGGEE